LPINNQYAPAIMEIELSARANSWKQPGHRIYDRISYPTSAPADALFGHVAALVGGAIERHRQLMPGVFISLVRYHRLD
jgi:hypothetical protein